MQTKNQLIISLVGNHIYTQVKNLVQYLNPLQIAIANRLVSAMPQCRAVWLPPNTPTLPRRQSKYDRSVPIDRSD